MGPELGSRPRRRCADAAAVIAVGGLAVATYIAIADASSGSPVCLAGGHGCETVANSKYSHLAGINVAVIGIAGYVLLLASAALRGDAGRFSGLLFAAIGFGFSASTSPIELFDDRCDLPVVRCERGPHDRASVVNATRASDTRVRSCGGWLAARRSASRPEERRRQEAAEAAAARRSGWSSSASEACCSPRSSSAP